LRENIFHRFRMTANFHLLLLYYMLHNYPQTHWFVSLRLTREYPDSILYVVSIYGEG